MVTRPGSRWQILLIVVGLAVGILTLKAVQDGWLATRLPVALGGKPALVFFTLIRGCPCQVQVVRRAEAQLASWEDPATFELGVIHVDFNQRRELAERYGIARAPALVLLDSYGEVVWKQDVGLSDEAPLDLAMVETRLRDLGVNPP